MSYSRRQLYALGEPLGDSVTTKKVGGGRIYGGGGGGGGSAPAAPSTSTSYSTNLPEYAQPYVTNMLNAAQAQIYKPDMTTFNEYKPYSNNPQDYIAAFSPLQQQAQSTAANMQVPGNYGIAGLQTYGLTNQMANAGRNFQNQATDPYATQAYMNPYLQASLQPQLQEMQRQYGITGAQEMGNATRAGAFGGSREALMAAENQRNKNIAMNQAIGQGYNTAFNNAQQQQLAAAQLGLQGQQAAMGGAGQLANIGGQYLNAQQGITNLQNTLGGQQQAQQQNVINQAIQNYATAQQYPYMQLGILNSMLRGLPMQSTTTASYQAQPSLAMQGAGLLGAAGSLYGGKSARTGGSVDDIKKMRSGGIAEVPGYRYGSIISEPQRESIASRMNDQQLNMVKGLPGITPDERNTFDSALINNQYVRSNPEAAQMMAQAVPPPQQPAPTDRMSGIAQAGGGMFNTMGNGMAGGGIVAFAGEGDSLIDEQRIQAEKDAAAQVAPAKAAEKAIIKDARKSQTRADYVKETQDIMRSLGVNPDIVGEKGKALEKHLETTQAGIPGREDQLERFARTKGFLSLLDPTEGRSDLSQMGRAFGKYVGEKEANIKTIDELRNTTIKAQAELEAGNRARAAGDIETASKHFDEARKLQNQIDVANIHANATLGAAELHAKTAGAASRQEEAKVEAYLKDHPNATRSEAYAAVAQYARGESNDIARMRYADDVLSKDITYINLRNSDKPADQAKADKIRDEVYKRYGVVQPAAVASKPTDGGKVDTNNPLLKG